MANWGWDTLFDYLKFVGGVALSASGMPQAGVPLITSGAGGLVEDAGAPTDEQMEERMKAQRPQVPYRRSQSMPPSPPPVAARIMPRATFHGQAPNISSPWIV